MASQRRWRLHSSWPKPDDVGESEYRVLHALVAAVVDENQGASEDEMNAAVTERLHQIATLAGARSGMSDVTRDVERALDGLWDDVIESAEYDAEDDDDVDPAEQARSTMAYLHDMALERLASPKKLVALR